RLRCAGRGARGGWHLRPAVVDGHVTPARAGRALESRRATGRCGPAGDVARHRAGQCGPVWRLGARFGGQSAALPRALSRLAVFAHPNGGRRTCDSRLCGDLVLDSRDPGVTDGPGDRAQERVGESREVVRSGADKWSFTRATSRLPDFVDFPTFRLSDF